jgi:general secretion pathway protein G
MLVRERQIRSLKVRGGYSLMEVLVVVCIIVVLAGIGGAYLLPKLDEAREDADLTQMKTLAQQCQIYKLDKDEYPPSLEALTQPKANGGPPYVAPEALKPRSQPNSQYRYDQGGAHSNGLSVDIWLDTPHGQIGSWMPKVQR